MGETGKAGNRLTEEQADGLSPWPVLSHCLLSWSSSICSIPIYTSLECEQPCHFVVVPHPIRRPPGSELMSCGLTIMSFAFYSCKEPVCPPLPQTLHPRNQRVVLLGSGWVIRGQKVNHGVLPLPAHVQISKVVEEKEEEEIRKCITCSPFL